MFDLFRSKKLSQKEQDLTGYASTRALCFEYFRRDFRPMELVHHYHWLKPNTAQVYYKQWKALEGPAADPVGNSLALKKIPQFMHDHEVREKVVAEISQELQISPEETENILTRPWGIAGIASGRTKKRLETLQKLKTIVEAIALIHSCKKNGLPPQLVLGKAREYVSIGEEAKLKWRGKDVNKLSQSELEEVSLDLVNTKGKLISKDFEAEAAILRAISQPRQRTAPT